MGNSVGFKRTATIIGKVAKDIEAKEGSPNKEQTNVAIANGFAMARLDLRGIIGQGTFSRVDLVKDTWTSEFFALKTYSKEQDENLGRSAASSVQEKKILSEMNNVFLVKLRATSKDTKNIYFLFDVVYGGDLFSRLKEKRRLDENEVQFLAAQILLAFEYLHSIDIIYRNLKPERILYSLNGYIKLCGFGFAKKVTGQTYTLCGTPEYLAPEVVNGRGHGKPVDWWSLGVLIYELSVGITPFYDSEPMVTYNKILIGTIKFAPHQLGSSKALISQLLSSKQQERVKSVSELKANPYFNRIDFDAIEKQTIEASFKPKPVAIGDKSNFDDYGNKEFVKGEPTEIDNSEYADF